GRKLEFATSMKRVIRSPRRRIRALRTLSSLLTGDDGFDLSGAGDVGLSPADWEDILGLANELRVAPAVLGALRRQSVEVPKRELLLFRQHHTWNVARNMDFRHRMTAAIEALNAVGIVPLLFKGSLLLLDGSVE